MFDSFDDVLAFNEKVENCYREENEYDVVEEGDGGRLARVPSYLGLNDPHHHCGDDCSAYRDRAQGDARRVVI